MKNFILCAAVVAALSGCASNQPVASAEEIGAREYPTGSNIPRKGKSATDGVKSYDREEIERARAQMPQAPRPGLGGGSP